jgi:hypothetical protein
MAVWNNSKMTSLYYDTTSADISDCEVRIDGKDIIVSYREEDEQLSVIWQGTEHGSGHYELTLEAGQGRASLHRFEKSTFLEGWWKEQGEEGMWRIELLK